jgi:glycosyltransferase involved in cell wall biosynthesis
MPVYNESSHVPATIEALVAAVAKSGFDAELVLVDDGSTDGSAGAAERAAAGRIPLRIFSQPNLGRFQARRAGLEAALGEFVLLLDGRVRLLPDALRFLHARVESGETVWNGHVHVEAADPFGRFWRLLAELAWRDYFDDPRTTSFGVEEFDRFPKGTTCFAAPRDLLLDVFAASRSRYADVRLGNDDTPLLRELARRRRISISPEFACIYTPRTSLGRFFRHSIHRGAVFLDGHGTTASRFFPVAVAFFPLSAGLLLASLRRPLVAPAAAVSCGLVAAAYGLRAGRSRDDVRALALVTPLYAAGHALGMWRGLAELLRGRFAR